MKVTEFQKLREIEEEFEMDSLQEGDYFLYGKSVINQKQNKESGAEITYYEVLSSEGLTVSYAPVFDILEDDIKIKK